MKISVVVPVYKVEKYLDRCVESILAQTFTDFEVILVDDGSPDNCPAMCDAWAEKDSRIKVIHKENGGLPDARNQGVKRAMGDYIAFVDSDDRVEKTFLSTLLDGITENDADIAQCNFRRVYNNKELYKYCYSAAVYDREYIENTLIPDMVNGKMYQISYTRWNKIYKSELVKSASKKTDISVTMGEDILLNLACLTECKKIVSLDTEALYNYRDNSESVSNTYSTDNKYKKILFYKNMESILSNNKYDFSETINYSMKKRLAYYIYECAISSLDYREKKKEIKEILSMVEKDALAINSKEADTLAKRVCFILSYLNLIDLMLLSVSIYKKIKRII